MKARRPWRMLAVLLLVTSCGGGGGGSGGGGGGGGEESEVFVQPTAGILVANGAERDGGAVPLLYVLSGDAAAYPAVAGFAAGGAEAETLPMITAVSKSSAQPFERVVLTGTGFRTTGAGMSVLFRAAGSQPVAVPVLAVTPTTVEVVVPPLFSAAGANVVGRATLQVVQAGTWGESNSNLFAGVDVAALPVLASSVRAGSVLDSYLQAALDQLDYLIGQRPGSLPDSYWTDMAAQRSALVAVQSAVRVVIADPAATPTVPSAGAGTVTLSAGALATADRLVAGMLLQLGPGLELTTDQTLPAQRPLLAAALPACPPSTTEAWIDDLVCQRQRYGFTLAELGARLVQIGAKFEIGFSLGVFGGMVTSGLAAAGSQLEAAFELTWTALSGHVAAWATSSTPPKSGDTLSDVGVTLLDRLAGTQGLLAAVYSTSNLLAEVDGAVEEAAEDPATNPWAGTWTGTYSLTVRGACTWHHGGGALINVNGAPGAYTGDYVLGGVQVLDETCGPNSVMSINGELSAVVASGTTFSATIADPDGDIVLRGTLSGTTITGTLTMAGGSGTFTVTKQ